MQNFERISALVDSAGSDADRAALPAICDDPAARQTWARYQLIGDLIRDNVPSSAGVEFAARVAAAITEQKPLLASIVTLAPQPRTRRWSTPATTGFAVAASAAMLGLFVWFSAYMTEPKALATADPSNTEMGAEDRVSSLSEADYKRRINGYLVNFNEQRRASSAPGAPPYVRLVGFDPAGSR